MKPSPSISKGTNSKTSVLLSFHNVSSETLWKESLLTKNCGPPHLQRKLHLNWKYLGSVVVIGSGLRLGISSERQFTRVFPYPGPENAVSKRKGQRRGRAELIQHLTISTDNYSSFLNILNHRYYNKELLFVSQASMLLNIPVSPKLSLNHVKRINSTTNKYFNANKNISLCGVYQCYILEPFANIYFATETKPWNPY